MVTVHHLKNSRSQRVLWLLELLDVEYEIKHYARDAKTNLAPDALKSIHPLGKSPVITDGDKVIAESGAMVEYLVETYGDDSWAFPKGSDEALDARYWLHYAEGSLMPLLVMQLVFKTIREKKMPFFAKPIANKICSAVEDAFILPNFANHMQFINDKLEGKTWLVGERISVADIQMSFPLEAVFSRAGRIHQQYPNIVNYVARIHAHPAYLSALEKGGDYAYGPQ